MSVRILHRRGTAEAWAAADPVLGDAERGFQLPDEDYPNGRWKTGKSGLNWSELPYDDDIEVALPGASESGITLLTGTPAQAREAIGAGTSNLALGTTGSTAKAGNWQPAAADITGSTATGRSLITGDDAAGRKTLGVVEYYDVRRSGALLDNSTDDTAAWAHAVSTVAAAGGGKIVFKGTSRVTGIELSNKVGILGLGKDTSLLYQIAGRPEGTPVILLDEPDAQFVSLEAFSFTGNKANQTTEAPGIYFHNNDGSSSNLAKHVIRDVYIRNVKGAGLHWGWAMRSSLIDGVHTYMCDGYGIRLSSFSDNTIQNCEAGQSGLHGIYITGGSGNSKYTNLKSWYSGRIDGVGCGIYQVGGKTNVFSNITTQENMGSGFFLDGTGDAIVGQVMSACSSDSDNRMATSSGHGLAMVNVQHSLIDISVDSAAPAAATPYSGVNISSNCSENTIRPRITPSAVSSWPIAGSGIGNNRIEMGRGVTASTPTGAYTPAVYRYEGHRLTLTAARTINNPVTQSTGAPVGFKLSFVIIQDATGGRVTTWGTAYKIPASATFDTTANTRTYVEFECVGNADWVMTRFTTGVPA